MRMAAHSQDEFLVAVQLAGCEPDVMAEAAKLNEDRGATIIDKCASSVKKVTNGDAGSALIRNMQLAARLIAATVSKTVTLKMRTGG